MRACNISKEVLFWFYFEHPFIRSSSKCWRFHFCVANHGMWTQSSCQVSERRKEACLKRHLKDIWKDRLKQSAQWTEYRYADKHKTDFSFASPRLLFCLSRELSLRLLSHSSKTSAPRAELFLILKGNWKHSEEFSSVGDLKLWYLKIHKAFIRKCPPNLREL